MKLRAAFVLLALSVSIAGAAEIPVRPSGELAKVDIELSNRAIAALGKGTPAERESTLTAVIAAPDRYVPPVLYAISGVLFRDGRKDEAMFWFYAGQLRGRFDAMRCADKSAGSAIGVLNQQFGPPINEYAFADPKKLLATVRRVVEWDEKTPRNYDHRWINLHGMGAFGAGSGGSAGVDEAKWPDLAREAREKFLSGMRSAVGDNPEDYFSDEKTVSLVRAATAGDTEKIDALVKTGADLNATGKDGATPLWFAMMARSEAGFAHLAKLGADPTKPFAPMRMSVARFALGRSDDVYLRLLLDAKLDPNSVLPETKKSLIFEAIGARSLSKLKLLAAAGADVNARPAGGATPILTAATIRQFDVVLFLLEHGADPALRDDLGRDLAAGVFIVPNLTASADTLRLQVVAKLEALGFKADPEALAKAGQILNLDEVTGKAPPKWIKDSKEPIRIG